MLGISYRLVFIQKLYNHPEQQPQIPCKSDSLNLRSVIRCCASLASLKHCLCEVFDRLIMRVAFIAYRLYH